MPLIQLSGSRGRGISEFQDSQSNTEKPWLENVKKERTKRKRQLFKTLDGKETRKEKK